MLTHLQVIIITVSLISRRLNVEIVPKVHPHKISIVCTNSPKALYPWWIIPREAWREELFGHWIAIGKVLAVFLLYLWRHCLHCRGGGSDQVKGARQEGQDQSDQAPPQHVWRDCGLISR